LIDAHLSGLEWLIADKQSRASTWHWHWLSGREVIQAAKRATQPRCPPDYGDRPVPGDATAPRVWQAPALGPSLAAPSVHLEPQDVGGMPGGGTSRAFTTNSYCDKTLQDGISGNLANHFALPHHGHAQLSRRVPS